MILSYAWHAHVNVLLQQHCHTTTLHEAKFLPTACFRRAIKQFSMHAHGSLKLHSSYAQLSHQSAVKASWRTFGTYINLTMCAWGPCNNLAIIL